MGMPTFFLCPAVWFMAPCRAACGESVGLPLMPVGGWGRWIIPSLPLLFSLYFGFILSGL